MPIIELMDTFSVQDRLDSLLVVLRHKDRMVDSHRRHVHSNCSLSSAVGTFILVVVRSLICIVLRHVAFGRVVEHLDGNPLVLVLDVVVVLWMHLASSTGVRLI